MKRVAIVGVGLIGGSFALALRAAGFDGEIAGVSSTGAIEAGLRVGAISRGMPLSEAAATADLIYLAQPVDRILETLAQLGAMAIPPATLITDAGSTKAAIVSKAAACIGAASFVGGHPLAGKEQTGAEHADAQLFRGRPYVLTRTADDTDATRDLRTWLARIGANVLDMSPAQHDETVAFTSHLPQLLSTALAATLAGRDDPHVSQVFGTGLLDMTRLALSSTGLWRSILETNTIEVTAALRSLVATLQELDRRLQQDAMVEMFDTGRRFAHEIRKLPCKD